MTARERDALNSGSLYTVLTAQAKKFLKKVQVFSPMERIISKEYKMKH